MHDLENQYDFILCETDKKENSSWTNWILKQVDVILLVADFSEDPNIQVDSLENKLDLYSGKYLAKKHLILIHPIETETICGTSKWIKPRKVDWHHHIKMSQKGDFERIARFMAAKIIGLVLGGGNYLKFYFF